MKNSGPSVEKYRNDLEVVRNTAAQVIRDFEIAGLEISFSGNHQQAYDELLHQVVPALASLYKKDPQRFMNLLYRIDVDERNVQDLSARYSGETFMEHLAVLVLEREFMKALFKKLYGSRNG